MKTDLLFRVLTALFLVLFSVSFSFFTAAATAAPVETDKETIMKTYGTLPLYFIENRGQLDPEVRLYVKTAGQTLYFTDKRIVFDLLRRGKNTPPDIQPSHMSGGKTERLVFNLWFDHASKEVLVEGMDRQNVGINSCLGTDKNCWKTNIPVYDGIVYKGIYQDIDLRIFGNGRDIEYEFVVHPGGNPSDIALTYHGIEGLTINENGELLIATAFGKLKETKPYIYQEIDGKRVVDGCFQIHDPASGAGTGTFSYGFQVAPYDPSYPLIIDPSLSYSTYLGGAFYEDYGYGIAVDGSGSAYITGYTNTDTFPTQSPYQGTSGGGTDAFVTKIDSEGALCYSTYLGGSDTDEGLGIAVDSDGCAYVTGNTSSSDFPSTAGVYQPTQAGTGDAFVTKLSASGASLSYSTYLGGSYGDYGVGIAVDSTGCAYVTGHTYSDNFPMQNAYQSSKGSNTDVFVTKLSAAGSALSYSTYLGGNSEDKVKGIAVDSSGCAYVTGYTYSTNFPTNNAYQSTKGSTYDAFVTKFSSTGSTLAYSTYLGGSSVDQGNGIAVDSTGCAYVTGKTGSSDFPTVNPYQATKSGTSSYYDAFVTKFSSSGSSLAYSTYLGGFYHEYGNGIAVDGSGNVYVTGETASSDFPSTADAYQSTNAGNSDAFISKLSASGDSLSFSTYLGGTASDAGYAIAIDRRGNPCVTGYTSASDFPVQNPAQPNYAGGSSDAFAAKVMLSAPVVMSPVLLQLLLRE